MGKNRLPWKSLVQFIACVFDLLVVSQYVTFLVEMLNTTDGVILVGMHCWLAPVLPPQLFNMLRLLDFYFIKHLIEYLPRAHSLVIGTLNFLYDCSNATFLAYISVLPIQKCAVSWVRIPPTSYFRFFPGKA